MSPTHLFPSSGVEQASLYLVGVDVAVVEDLPRFAEPTQTGSRKQLTASDKTRLR
jgi:hypothetical protein